MQRISTRTTGSRGVLDGAFAVLEALAGADEGLGLTELARASGLAKTSTYRLTEKLLLLGAVQRTGRRYYIGARMGRIGQRWQPDPLLRQVTHASVHVLAAQCRAMASLRVLHDDTLWVICATAPPAYAYLPAPIDRDSVARTATGRVLYAADGTTDVELLPGSYSPREWRQLRKSIRDPQTTVTDRHEAFPGVCCVSAPVWWPSGRCAGALTVSVQGTAPAPMLPDLVWRSARRIDGRLAAIPHTGSGGKVAAAARPDLSVSSLV